MIRAAGPGDTHAIASLIRALVDYERLSDHVILDAARLSEHLFGEHRYAEVLLTEEDATVVGFALFFHTYSTFLSSPGIWLEDLFVLPDYRRHGHGRALIAALSRLALERGCARLEWSVLDWNEPSIAFYRSLGAQALSDWTTYRLSGTELAEAASD